MLALLCVVWGLNFSVAKGALEVMNPMHFQVFRFGFALPPLAAILLIDWRRRRSSNPPAEDAPLKGPPARGMFARLWVRGAVIGLLLWMGFSLQIIGLKYTTASRSGFFTGLVVVAAPLLAFVLRTSRTPRFSWFGVVPAVAGVYLLAGPNSGGMNIGDWLTILCAIVFGGQMVALEALAGPVGDTWRLTFIQVAVVFLGTVIWCLVEGATICSSPAVWLAVGYTAVFGTVATVWLQTRFQPEVPAGHAALVYTLEPVFAAGFAWLLLGDRWTTLGLFGAALILAAMVVSSYAITRST